MGDKTKIEWSDATWNPVTGCTHAGSPACDNCYARCMAKRLQSMGQKNYENGFKVTEHPHMLEVPLKWKRSRRIFVCSMGDLFHEDVSDGFIAAVFGVMAASPQHVFQVLTKRVKRAKYWFEWIEEVRGGGYTVTPDFRVLDAASQYGVDINLSTEYEWPLSNVWIGATVENQRSADSRIAHLLKIPATIRFISVEPMLYSIDLQEVSLGGTLRGDVLNKVYGPVIGPRPFRRPMENGIDWVICGGESGVNARPTLLRWIRELRDQCISAEVPFMFKQWGEWVNNSQVWVITKNFRKILVENEVMCRVGKANSGKYLDQKLHLEYPKMESK